MRALLAAALLACAAIAAPAHAGTSNVTEPQSATTSTSDIPASRPANPAAASRTALRACDGRVGATTTVNPGSSWM